MPAEHERISGRKVKGLYIGIQTPGTTSQLRADTLCNLLPACDWNLIDTDPVFLNSPRWARSMWFRFRAGPAVAALNRLVQAELGTEQYDVAWIDKGVCLWPETVRQIRQIARKLVYYTPDASFLANRSRYFRATASLYDLIVTTKSLELASFERLVPRKRIALVTQCFDTQLHYPRCTLAEKRKEAVLIGLCEPDRERCVEQLIAQGIAVRVGGFGWERFVRRHAGNSLVQFEGARVFGQRYSEVLSRATIGLGLMTKRFPELHTTRTFEIPACGTALATERNSETIEIFGDEEAIFFADYADLGRRVSALMHDEVRLKTITEAGTRRVQTGDYSNDRVLRKMLELVGIPCGASAAAVSGHVEAAVPAMGNTIGLDCDTVAQNRSGNYGRGSLLEISRSRDVSFPVRTTTMVSHSTTSTQNYCIGFLGADWWGSDPRALAGELRQRGHMLVERHYEDYFPNKWKSLTLRGARRLLRWKIAAEYNRAVEELLQIEAMDFLLVFKGMLLAPKTLKKFRDAGKPCYCFYPDVSYRDPGANIWDCLPFYDCVFTTKSFHQEDRKLTSRVKRLQFVPHGFDPEVHRAMILQADLHKYYGSDVSFVGVWSPKKEKTLAALIAAMPDVGIKIWGPFWDRAQDSVRNCWQGRAAYGDELAAICSCTAINLGLLSEAGRGTVKGDQTTARTWQIPACGGFLLHEDTKELRDSFVVGDHIAVFGADNELAASVRRYLTEPDLRERMRLAAYQHCLNSEYSYRTAANRILSFHQSSAAPS